MSVPIPVEIMRQLPAEQWMNFIDTCQAYPHLPHSAHIAVMQYGKVSTEEFEDMVPAEWSGRVRRLAEKLNAAAVAVVVEKESLDPALQSLKSEVSKALKEDHLLASLWLLITVFFSEGEEAATYFFLALQATAMAKTGTTVERLDIPAPMKLWKKMDWHSPRIVMCLFLVLADRKEQMQSILVRLSRTLGPSEPDLDWIKKHPSQSLREEHSRAESNAENLGHTTIFGVDLWDKGLLRFKEENPESELEILSFRRMFVVGVCPKGTKIWHAGGIGRVDAIKEHNERQGPGVMEADEVKRFLDAFGLLVNNGKGRWNSKAYKRYERCFGVDLRRLQTETGKDLLVDYETWVDIYMIPNVRTEAMAKLKWE